eukprot:EG_transcript_7285
MPLAGGVIYAGALALTVALCLWLWTPWRSAAPQPVEPVRPGPSPAAVARGGGGGAAEPDPGHCGPLALDVAFRSGMVLQHTKPCIAGSASAPVRLSDGNATAEANPTHCRFVVCLPARPASPVPASLTVQCRAEKAVLEDVLFGDVFYCTGQSNMMLALTHQSTQPLNSSYTYRDTLRRELAAVGPVMRVFVSREWRAPSVPALKGFSSVCWFFGFRLYQALNSPVRPPVLPLGLIADGLPGMPIVAFLEPRRVSSCGNSTCRTLLPQACGVLHTMVRQKRLRGVVERPHHPAYAYKYGVIRTFEHVEVRGVLFYQGETDLLSSSAYACRQRVLLEQLRAAFGPATPFVFTVIAGVPRACSAVTAVRLAQLQLLRPPRPPHVAYATAHDLGHPLDIHPPDKREVGRRLALAVQGLVYGGGPGEGPAVVSVAATLTARGTEATVVLHFGPASAAPFVLRGSPVCGLCCSVSPFVFSASAGVADLFGHGPGPPTKLVRKGRMQCGTDPPGWLRGLQTVADGTRVTVTVPVTPAQLPQHVRHGYEDFPQCGVYDRFGLPALPFERRIVWGGL